MEEMITHTYTVTLRHACFMAVGGAVNSGLLCCVDGQQRDHETRCLISQYTANTHAHTHKDLSHVSSNRCTALNLIGTCSFSPSCMCVNASNRCSSWTQLPLIQAQIWVWIMPLARPRRVYSWATSQNLSNLFPDLPNSQARENSTEWRQGMKPELWTKLHLCLWLQYQCLDRCQDFCEQTF